MDNFKISIPKPCHEDWNKFTPDEKGAFCKVCSKSVHDFTKRSAHEIKIILVEEINAGKKVCGRFNESQLTPVVKEIPSLSPYDLNFTRMKRFAMALFLVFGGYLFNSVKVSAQKTMGKISIASRPEPIQGEVSPRYAEPPKEPVKPKTVCLKSPITKGDIMVEPILGRVAFVEPVVKGGVTYNEEPTVDMGLVEYEEQFEEEMMLGEVATVEDYPTMGSISVLEDSLLELTAPVDPIPLDNDSAIILLSGMQQVVEEDFAVKESTYVEAVVAPTLKGEENISTEEDRLFQEASVIGSEQADVFQCYPNPSKGSINVKYNVKENAYTSIFLYDMNGSLVKILVPSQKMYAADYSSQFDISDLQDGIYFCELTSGEEKITTKIILNK